MKKINCVKRSGKLSILPEEADKYFKGETVSLSYRSCRGYNNWAQRLSDAWGISGARARLYLILNEKVDLTIVDNLTENEVTTIMTDITPFREGAYLIPEWVEQGYWRTRSFNQYQILKFWNDKIPGITWALASFFNKYCYSDLNVAKDVLRGKTSWVRTPGEFLRLVFGSTDIEPFLAKGYSLLSLVKAEISLPGILRKLNLRYMDREKMLSVYNMLKGGSKPSEIFPKLTKAEANKVASVAASLKYSRFSHDDIYVQLTVLFPDVKARWIYIYPKSVKVAKWAIAHFDQLNQVREYTTHGGESVTIHVHRMLDYVCDEHLPRGEKTGFHYVRDQLKEVIEAEIKEQLKEDQPLPKFPLDIESQDDRIWQILSSHELRDEGKVMNHCVGGYIKMALRRTCWIFHVDLDDNSKGATVEVKDNGNGDYYINQSMLPGNIHSQKAADIVMKAIEKYKNNNNKK